LDLKEGFSGFQVLKCGSAGVLGAGVGLIERGSGGSGGLIGFKRKFQVY